MGWFVLAFVAVVLGPLPAALVYGTAAALAARQVVRAWRSVQWQADLAAGLVAVPVLAALVSLQAAAVLLVVALVGALVAGFQEPASGLRGGVGGLAAAGILVQAVGPVAVAGIAMVTLSSASAVVAAMLVMLASGYEAGDFIIGSGGSTSVEGPLAGMVTFVLVGFPGALVWLEPFDVMQIWVLIVAAVTCVFGQWLASATLPRPDADVPALRRIDTLLVLAPIWVAAVGAF